MSTRHDHVVLAIESSCDETCAAVVHGRTVLSNVVASQAGLHERYGGVVPEIASRRHLELVDAVVEQALAGSDAEPTAVAATQGPGLVGALLVGLSNAKARAWGMGLPFIPVDHLAGHVASALLADDPPEPPFLCLLVSGGHTMMLDVDVDLSLTLLGTTRDDAAGEAFDKGARLLGLGMPGGPAIQRLAAQGDGTRPGFTPAMVHHDTLDTSFAGIKTALAVAVRSGAGHAPADLAASLQGAIVDTLVACVRKTLDRMPQRTTMAVVGGVAANAQLRDELVSLGQRRGVRIVTIPLRYCADNAAMIGVAAGYRSPLQPPDFLHVDAFASSPLFSRGILVPT